MDDILIEARGEEQAVDRFRKVLQRARENGIKLACHKVQLGPSVPFSGLHISGSQGYKPIQGKLDAILGLEPPKTLTELRSFMGCINQLKNFIPDLAQNIVQMRQLLKKDTSYMRTEAHQEEFIAVREILKSPLRL